MSNRRRLWSAFIAFFVLGAADLLAQDAPEKPWRVDNSIGIFSDYMFRGQNLFPGASIQPSITGTYDTGMGEISGNLWMHLSGENGGADEVDSFTELDETLRYTYLTDDYAFSTGFSWYTYPDSSDDINSTAEVFASFTLVNDLNPVLSVYHDYDEYDSQYYELGISHVFEEVAEGVSLTPYAGLGFASNSEKIYADDGLVQTTIGVSAAIPVGELQLVPSINYTFESDKNAVNEFWSGMSLNYRF